MFKQTIVTLLTATAIMGCQGNPEDLDPVIKSQQESTSEISPALAETLQGFVSENCDTTPENLAPLIESATGFQELQIAAQLPMGTSHEDAMSAGDEISTPFPYERTGGEIGYFFWTEENASGKYQVTLFFNDTTPMQDGVPIETESRLEKMRREQAGLPDPNQSSLVLRQLETEIGDQICTWESSE